MSRFRFGALHGVTYSVIEYTRKPRKRLFGFRGPKSKKPKIVETYTWKESAIAFHNTCGICVDEVCGPVLNRLIRHPYSNLYIDRKPMKVYTKPWMRLICSWRGIEIL